MLRGRCWLDENYPEDRKVRSNIGGAAGGGSDNNGAGINVVAGDGEAKDPCAEGIV